MKVAAGQLAPTTDPSVNRRTIETLVEEASAEGVELLVLPEEAMLLADGLEAPLGELARAEWPGFVEFVSGLARQHRMAIIAAGYEGTDTDRPYNTIVAIDEDGKEAARYRKLHLYDAFLYRESDYVTPGDANPVVVELAGTMVGLVNCYDLRFPELTRNLIDHGADLLSVSAAWVSGAMKEDHWRTLLRARAIESTAWLVAAGSASPECIGQSMIVDPFGIVRSQLGGETYGLAITTLSQRRTEEVRAVLPVLENRRLNTTIEL
ncbi:carbon-nitrogen hydrolase family protein [Leifsonia shinshuensis]|uniref:carbon-nitrogen hydrolase family protein n=1 Tax=Leifsonia shinshuensis TaxID=150026 RepID=UPI001F50C46F|nr:carbon-nitrogen hydrolase family protein [Leifsonia shinshuensis]MCI0156448.1 carbon-nitrogen hydrolase family protein [Leifsonia shinshuensis]